MVNSVLTTQQKGRCGTLDFYHPALYCLSTECPFPNVNFFHSFPLELKSYNHK